MPLSNACSSQKASAASCAPETTSREVLVFNAGRVIKAELQLCLTLHQCFYSCHPGVSLLIKICRMLIKICRMFNVRVCCNTMLYCAALCCAVLAHAVLRRAVPGCALLGCPMVCCAALCHAVLCFAVLCFARLTFVSCVTAADTSFDSVSICS